MTKLKILIADEIDTSGLRLLPKNKFSVSCEFGITNEEILKSFSRFDVLVIRSIRKIDRKFLANSYFKIIATCSKGTDHIDTEYAGKKGIRILNADDSNNISAAEHTLGLIISVQKNILLSDSLVRNNKFGFYDYQRNELFGKNIGIIGFGKVGSYVGKLSKAFGMNVLANDIDKNVISGNKDFVFKSCRYILKNCDIITIHIPMSKKNFRFISEDKMKLIGKESILINTSRGDVIDEKYLLKILKQKKIRFAGLDVFSHEPDINKEFAELDNVLLTNHIAGKTIESKRKISDNIFNQIKNI
jgi:D-3-phosphoglycerate dehydrogenase